MNPKYVLLLIGVVIGMFIAGQIIEDMLATKLKSECIAKGKSVVISAGARWDCKYAWYAP